MTASSRNEHGATRLALVTGATGYIGGRLVPALLEAGFDVRVLVRNPAKIRDRDWSGQVDVADRGTRRTRRLWAVR